MSVWQRMREILLGSLRLFVDGTRDPVFDLGRGRTKTGYVWSIAGDDRAWRGGAGPPAVVHTYSPCAVRKRCRRGPKGAVPRSGGARRQLHRDVPSGDMDLPPDCHFVFAQPRCT